LLATPASPRSPWRGGINAALFCRALTILNLAGQDIDHELGELVCVAGALLAFRSAGHLFIPGGPKEIAVFGDSRQNFAGRNADPWRVILPNL
jgi:hypothetical protein